MAKDYSEYSKEALIMHIQELKKQLKSTKYGIYWDKSIEAEKVANYCKANIPVLKRNEELTVYNGENLDTHILIEGDNLHVLTTMNMMCGSTGFVDAIYIDPPYNTGTKDFAYNDVYVDKEDGFRHSKWISFMEKRLMLSKNLLSERGIIFISIDDNEHASLKMLCDKIFGETNFLTTIGWEKRTKCQNTKTARKMLQPKIEYVLVYKNYSERAEFNCHVVGKKEYPEEDKKGKYRLEEVGQMGASGIRGRGSMVFPILGVMPKKGNQWKLGKATIEEFEGRSDLLKIKGKVYRKIRPNDESSESIKPFWAFFSAEQFGTAETAKAELSEVLGTKQHGFETVKPLSMMEELLFQSTNDDSTILDFFAGSGSTGQAVLELNKEYGGHRKFILCTDNENDICQDITYPRLKTASTGKREVNSKYSDGIPANLMYYKTDFIDDSNNTDQAKYSLVEKVDELLCISEGIYVCKERTAFSSHYAAFDNEIGRAHV